MTEAQKICNKKMHAIPSCNHYPNYINKDRIYKIKCAKYIIQDLERLGPAGLPHIPILCNIIGKPIKIWNADGSLNKILGKGEKEHSVDIEYHATNSEQIGHWTLKHGKDPDNTTIDLNSCLFSVIGSQIGQNSSELRKWTVLKLKDNFQELINWMNEIHRLKKNGGIMLMIGGARYIGTSPSYARIILDDSQGAFCHNCRNPGHPRGHASHSNAEGHIDSVENYSMNSRKTGFLSRIDQDYVAHLALKTRKAQNAMNFLNEGHEKTPAHILVEEMEINPRNPLPRAKVYLNGGPISPEMNFHKVILILAHQEGQFNNQNANVFVLTFYPVVD